MGVQLILNGTDLGLSGAALDEKDAPATTFSYPITPAVRGVNTVEVRVRDSNGVPSSFITRKFKVLRPLLLNVSGDGAGMHPGLHAQVVSRVGKPYAITAVPSKGQMFAGWSILSAHSVSQIGTTTQALQLPVLNFIHREGLALARHLCGEPLHACRCGPV